MAIINSISSTDLSILLERQRAQLSNQTKQSGIGIVNGHAPVEAVETVEKVSKNSFATMMANPSLVQDEDEIQAKIEEGNRVLEEIKAHAKPGTITPKEFTNLGGYLTEQDKAFLDNLDVDEKLKLSMSLNLALDRKSGALQGPITAAYLFGDGGLMDRVGYNLNDALLKGEEVDSILDVMANMRELSKNIMAALEKSQEVSEAAEEDSSINIYNADEMLADDNSLVKDWLSRMLEQLEEDEEFQKQLADNSGERKWSPLKVIEESSKMLV